MSTITHASAPSWAAAHRALIVLLAAVAVVMLAVTITVLNTGDASPTPAPPAPAPPTVFEPAPRDGSGYYLCRDHLAQGPSRAC